MNLENKYWHFTEFKLARRLSRAEKVDMSQAMEMKYYKKGAAIKLGGDESLKYIYFLKKGTVKIALHLGGGKEVIKYIIKKGDIFGVLNIFEIEERQDHITALEDTIICVVDSDYFKNLMDKNQKLNNYIFKLAGLRIKKLERNLTSLLYKDAESRIQDFIIDYVKDFGFEENGYYSAKNLLSNNDIGKLTSTSRQTVNKTLNNLKRANIIYFDKHIIRVDKKIILN